MSKQDRSVPHAVLHDPVAAAVLPGARRGIGRVLALCLAVSAITGCGEHTEPALVSLHVNAPGMHCEGCVETVENTLRKLPGVDSVKANLAGKDVFVSLDTVQTTRREIESIIEKLGFAEAGRN